MINSIDDSFTTYTDEESTDAFLENIEGTYEGIGCTVSMDINNNMEIIKIFKEMRCKVRNLIGLYIKRK